MVTATPANIGSVCALVPMAHVASVPRSIAFYERLGFAVRDLFTPPDQPEPNWAWLQSGGASLMVVRASAPISGAPIILCLYCDDVPAFHAMLRRAGVPVEEITYPPERPSGRFRVTDPDGYDLAITHT
jgi:catechol 2,3-dioxygenase-like lactoylglutathione lyase family enzyme